MKQLILTSVLMCLGCAQLEGTTVVVVRTPKHFVVAADSLWIGVNPASPSQVEHEFFCKIVAVGHMYFVATTSEVDARQLMTFALQAMKTSATVAEAAHRLALKSDEIARRTAEMAPQSSIDRCSKLSCAEGMFLGIENGVSTMVHLDFVQSGNSRKNLKFIPHTYTCPGNCSDIPWNIFFLGQTTEIAHIRQRNPSFVKGYSDQEVARKLVELEEKADPEEVGGPIDLLTLDARGGHWEPVEGGTCSPEETKRKRQNRKTGMRSSKNGQ
jgi:hypothetical protein